MQAKTDRKMSQLVYGRTEQEVTVSDAACVLGNANQTDN